MTVLYTAHVHVAGGRDGRADSDDKKLSLTLSRPGSSGGGTNPEQLFAAGYAACFASAIAFVAGQKKLETGAISIQSDVTLNQNEGGFFIEPTLNVQLPAIDRALAEELVREAHKVCPYSKAVRGNVNVALKLNGTPLEIA
ncbi:MAG: organic hydroperoxide resistance protein [Micavibrio sp.]|nr:organic hydroperoxide resistance protein [Micavibrio sp.]